MITFKAVDVRTDEEKLYTLTEDRQNIKTIRDILKDNKLIDPLFFGLSFTFYDFTCLNASSKYSSILMGDHLYECNKIERLDIFEQVFFEYYDLCIKYAIIKKNLALVYYLWSGLYYNDRNCPDFNSNVTTALKYGDIPILSLTILGASTFNTFDGVEQISLKEALEICKEYNTQHYEEISCFLHKLVSIHPQCQEKETCIYGNWYEYENDLRYEFTSERVIEDFLKANMNYSMDLFHLPLIFVLPLCLIDVIMMFLHFDLDTARKNLKIARNSLKEK